MGADSALTHAANTSGGLASAPHGNPAFRCPHYAGAVPGDSTHTDPGSIEVFAPDRRLARIGAPGEPCDTDFRVRVAASSGAGLAHSVYADPGLRHPAHAA